MPRPLDLPPLRNWQDFEDLCLDLWRRLWNDPDGQKHGRQGQPQSGVDVYGRDSGQWVGVQCKRLEADLTPKVIEEEVEKARTFEPPLSRFVLATTAQSDIHCQKAARKITEAGFPVTVVSWDEICHHLEDHSDLLRKYFPALIDPQPAGYRCMAVPPEKGFVEREELEEIRAILCEETTSAVGITSALRGAGGFGKTTLAQALCFDDRVRAAYPDGILWTTIGDQATPADRLSRVLDLIRWWRPGEAPHFDTVEAAAARLREILAGRRVLVVVDDAWTAADVEPFRGAGAGLLVTSRHHEALADCVCVDVDAMRLGEAVKLLMAELPGAEGLRPRFEDLARTLGEWPILLKLVNRTLRERVQVGLSVEKALERIHQSLTEAGLEAFDRKLHTEQERDKAVSLTMEVSLRLLSENERRGYEALAIFPEDEDVPLQAVERLWSCSASDAEQLVLRLYGLSLLLSLDLDAGTLRLHDVFRKYLIGRQRDAIVALHQDFLSRSRPATGRWADLPASESYLWRWLPYHLVHAGQSDTLRDLLLDIRFLAARLRATDVNVVIDGFDRLSGDSDLRMVQSAIRMSAHVLVRHPEQLAGQLLGRLPERTEGGKLLGWERFRREAGGAGFLPRRASLTPAGGPLLRTFEGHTDSITAVAAMGEGQALSAAGDGTLRLWDLWAGTCLHTLEGHGERVTAVAVVRKGWGLSGSNDGTMRLWDLETGACLCLLEGHCDGVTAVAAVGEGRALSGGGDGTVRLWDLEMGTCYRIFEGHTDLVTAVAAVGERRALSGSRDGTVRLWDLETGACLRTFKGHTGLARGMAVVGEDRVLLGGEDRILRLWDLETGTCLRTFDKQAGRIRAVSVVGKSRALSGADDRTMRLWDLETGACLRTFEGHASRVNAVAAVGEDRALSGTGDGMVKLWNLGEGAYLRTSEGHAGWVRTVAAVGQSRVLSGADDGAVRLWDPGTGACLRTFEGYGSGVLALAAVGEEGRVLSGTNDGRVRLWDLETGACLRTFEEHTAWINTVAAVGEGRALSGASDGTVRLWDLGTGACLRTLEGHTDWVNTVAAVGETQALSGADDETVRLWDLGTGVCLRTFEGHTGSVRAVAAVGEGYALSGASDGTVRLWDLIAGTCLRTFEGHGNWVTTMAPLGMTRALSGSKDAKVRLWDLATGACLAAFTFDYSVRAIATLDGVVVVGDAGGNVHFLDLILSDSH